jgi:hypothetical protein
MRRCVEIWNQRGKYASVTWTWPDGLACPEYSTSVELLQQISHDHFVRTVLLVHAGFVVTGLSVFLLGFLSSAGKQRRQRSTCRDEVYV